MMTVMLLVGGMTSEAWAAKVTYHILTLPIDPMEYNYHMVAAVTNKRLEAFQVTVDNWTSVDMPSHYKSPLAENFTYYKPDYITKSGPIQLYTNTNTNTKGYYYEINVGAVAETAKNIDGNEAEYYVVYTYKASNEIAKLDGSVKYNIHTRGRANNKSPYTNKGFFALNRGRNNRPAVLPTANVNPEMLASEDFMRVSTSGSGVSPYWSDGNNRNDTAITKSRFFFGFKFEGLDPYHIVIRSSYDRDTTYIEKNDGTNNFVYKWYKEASLFAVRTANAYLASDEHILYKTTHNPAQPNPIDPAYDDKEGNWHGQTGQIWSTVALLPDYDGTGYVFMGTRTVEDGNGVTPGAPYYLKEANTCNNLVFNKVTLDNVSNNLSIEGIYPLKNVTFKIATPFYKISATQDHIISAPTEWVSQYTVNNDVIETKYLPAALKRKYVTFTGKFYSDPACTQEITKFSQAIEDPTEGYQVYVGYSVDNAIPFKALSPSASYTTATWYELTDEGSTQEYGRKIKYDGSSAYKNNGAAGVFERASEFAFVGDPYELKVLYRESTEDASANRYVTLSTYDTWDIPIDATVGSFLLRKYKDANEGKWAWDAGQTSVAVTYGSDPAAQSVGNEAQTITLNITGLTGTKYYKITTGGAGASQIKSVVPSAGSIVQETGSTATITIQLTANTTEDPQEMTITIQEYNDEEGKTSYGTASEVAITQGTTSSFAGNTVEYSTSSSTRIKVLELPKHDFTYHIVDKSGRIAVKATVSQTIFSPLSLASIPSIILSPYLVGETVTFYRTYSGGGRGNLSDEITQLTAGNAAIPTNVYVNYTTSALDAKPYKLSENEEFNVKLNGHYIYCTVEDEKVVLKSTDVPDVGALQTKPYTWKLRNRDPYAMLIDNMGARDYLGATGSEPVDMYNDDGSSTSKDMQVGAWVDLASIVNEGELNFTKVRADAQQFVAKASLQTGVYEVMVADGGANDASTTYYNIGCPSDNTIKIYNNSTYAHGKDELRFVLNKNVDYQYYLIDKANHLLLTTSSKTPELALSAEYQSPLVETYNFYSRDMMTINTSKTPYEYTPTDPAVKLTSIDSLYASYTIYSSSEGEYTGSRTATDESNMKAQADTIVNNGDYYFKIGSSAPFTYKKVTVTRGYRGLDIYVTYDVNDVVTFNTAQYMLRFLNPLAEGYYLEDGKDNLDTVAKIQAVYPYCNGDGNLNIYGAAMQNEQFNGGASTRPRWVWYFDSYNEDPYHVRIRSRSTINYNSVSYSTYLTTYAVHFNQDTGEDADKIRIVTGGTLPGIASVTPTEYMVLGSEHNYKLMTTETIDDGESNERRFVTSLEQYWKTYNMIKLCVLGISKSTDAYSDDASTWVVPADKRPILNDSLANWDIGSGEWHSYTAFANATRWNGFNDKTNGHGSKVVERIEHWYQTFDMGDGAFEIESADIPPMLILLDRHGWEIMRRPLPKAATYPTGEELAGLKVYDSPLVEKYYFYSNATKTSGCHKYSMRLQNGAERDQVKVNGVRYSSTSLAALPPITATGVVSGGAIQDLYVIYDVKKEYERNYTYHLDTTTNPNAYTESGVSQPYLVLQNGRFYKTENQGAQKSYFTKPIKEHTNPEGGNIYDLIVSPHNHGGTNANIIDGSGNFLGNNFWYVKPNLNIDDEMGIDWIKATGEETEQAAKNKIKKDDYKNNRSGFDPYNIQIQLVNGDDGNHDGRYITTHIDTVRLENGILVGDYTGKDPYGGDGSKFVTLEYEFDSYAPGTNKGSEDYDHTYLQISNQTFMAVSDANGNMQLMPRFDHTKRVNVPKNDKGDGTLWSTTLEDPVDHDKAFADDNDSQGPQTTFFFRPQRFHYQIIDNYGREALRYKRGADYYPTITEHFKSPLAKDYIFYKDTAVSEAPVESNVGEWGPAQAPFKRTLTSESLLTNAARLLPIAGTYFYRIGTRGVFTYKKVVVTTGLEEQEITGSFAEAGLTAVDDTVYVRYDYDEQADLDREHLLQGQWFTVQLDSKDMKASGTVVLTAGETQGTGVDLYSGSKPGTIDATAKEWQWKFFVAPADTISDYYVKPDPYAVHLFNRKANHTTNPSLEPSPMSTPIKVPNENNGADRFALLAHPSGGYALVVAKKYDNNYNYLFVNGGSMTTSVGASTAAETSFNYKNGTITDDAQLVLNDDIEHNYKYYVLTNNNNLAIIGSQTHDEASTHNFEPYLPDTAQSPLLNVKDYLYYGFASHPSANKYIVIPQTKLYTLSGLYDDTVYVRYNAYNVDSTSFKIPNMRNNTGTGQVARNTSSIDVAMNINGELPYNIVWYNDNMMMSNGTTISDGESHTLSGDDAYVWYFTGNDPYALKIKHKGGKYIAGTDENLVAEGDAPTFMMLRKTGYDYGILQQTGLNNRLTGVGDGLTTENPTKYIIFGLSIHKLIYHLIIAKSCPDKSNPKAGESDTIPYRTAVSGTLRDTIIYGTTQRDLTAVNDGAGPHYAGEKYQLGSTLSWGNPSVAHTYSYDAGSVSLGDTLILPNVFYRTNCLFEFFIEGIYHNDATGDSYTELDAKYQGLKLGKLMSDELLIDQDVVVNVVYKFDPGLETNAGDGFVTKMNPAGSHDLWYTFETAENTPQLAHYTYVGGMRAEKGRALHYTNDYLWSPLGDPYGFRSYNRYIYKNSGETTWVLTTDAIVDGARVKMGSTASNENRGIYELLPSANQTTGSFLVHPLLDTGNTLFLDINNDGEMILSDDLPAKEWTYGLSPELLKPYYQGAGNIGGLTAEAKANYEEALTDPDAFRMIRRLQRICYNKDSVIAYKPGYYRLFSQPGASSLSPVRYASGYLHKLENDVDENGNESDAIPMHFYSKAGVNQTFNGDINPLKSGFTSSAATRGDIPIPATEADPSTILYFDGTNINTRIQTQGRYVKGVEAKNDSGYVKMTADAESATSFKVADIGGAVVLIYNEAESKRHYINYGQNDAAHIYDLQYYEQVDVDGSKWSMQPADTMGLKISTHNGGDGYYYATFCAPFDVALPNDNGGKTYNAYTCSQWYNNGVHPVAVPATNTYAEGKFVPAGTPVIIRVKDESGSVSLSLPSSSPSSALSCVFSGQYLEQLLAVDATHDVYTLGLPMTSNVSKDGDYDETGAITAPLPEFDTRGVGFYINATRNKENDPLEGMWLRNNRYVEHNKIYYREGESSGARAPKHNSGVEFVPVIFGDEDEHPESPNEGQGQQRVSDGCVYDILGRKVATAQEVKDGTWYQSLSPGIYIVNGQKIYIH